MTPARAAAAKNIKNAADDQLNITDKLKKPKKTETSNKPPLSDASGRGENLLQYIFDRRGKNSLEITAGN
jgi:hypothetical protein